MHGTALAAHPISALNTFLLGRTTTVTGLTLLVRVKCFVVKELLQRHQEHIALHGTNASRWHNALCLAEWTEERLAWSYLRLSQARLQTVETEAV